jgi:preprotein translocase subunit SecE
MSWFTRTQTFIGEVRSEMKKVSFPSRDEVVGTTVVVLITSAIFAVFLGLSDVVIQRLYQGIIEVFRS